MEAELTPERSGSPGPGAVPASALDRLIPLVGESLWQSIGWAAVVVVALSLRLLRLDAAALNPEEAAHAYQAWALFRGQPPIDGTAISKVSPLLLLLQGFAFFLFGASDVVARLVPAVTGSALVLLPLALRRWVGNPAALGMAALLAISPTAAYAARTLSPEILIATLTVVALAALARLGNDTSSPRLAAIILGAALGATFASGPTSISVGLTVVVGVIAAAVAEPRGVLAQGWRALRGQALLLCLLAALATIILTFTRLLSYPGGMAGIAETLAAWWQLLAGPGSGQAVALFLLVLAIYEGLALIFALVALTRDLRQHSEAIALFTAWGLAALLLWSFSAGRTPEQAIHVVLPILLLAGIGLGMLCHAIAWPLIWRGVSGVIVLAMLGFVMALAAVGVLLSRVNAYGGGLAGAMPPVAVLCLVVVPLAYVIWRLGSTLGPPLSSDRRQPILLALLVLALLFAAFGLRSANLLAFYRANTGTELLAQQTSTLGTLPSIERFLRLARDVGVNDGSARDLTGSHGVSIAIEQGVTWPYIWYFREFPDLTVVAPGSGGTSGAQVIIAASDSGLSSSGYEVSSWPWRNTVPPQYLEPNMASIVGRVLNPSHWLENWQFLLFRSGITPPPPLQVTLGMTPELAGRVRPATGPFNLGDSPGSGTENGQFIDPIGVTVAEDGTISVVDSGNGRVQRFHPDGTFLDIWGGPGSTTSLTRTENGLGPTGITTAPNGETWVADTWGHRVVALDATGQIVQVIGTETIDTTDDPAMVQDGPGRFFGPRDMAVTADAIYVVDTGNERVQKFAPDGTFQILWGGYGSGPGQLIEPVGIAIGPDGNVYIADSGNARIAIFTPNGEPVAQWPIGDWPVPQPGGLPPAFQPYLAFDAAGNLYASASNAGEVIQINPQGEIVTRVTAANDAPLAQPIGLAIASTGDVLVSDVGRDAVLTYVPVPAEVEATPVG